MLLHKQYKSSNAVRFLLYGSQNFQICKNLYFREINLEFIDFRNRRDLREDIHQRHIILSVCKLNIYKMLKLVLRSVYQLHSEKNFNQSYRIEKSIRIDPYNLFYELLSSREAGRTSVGISRCQTF